jgi:hypothetical protein
MAWQRCVSAALLAALLAPAGAQESDSRAKKALYPLINRQERTVEGLQNLLRRIDTLTEDLDRRGEKAKADLLRQAVAIVTEKSIEVDHTAASHGTSHKELGDLETAMNEMARILKEDPNRTEEVQRLGQKVVGALEHIVHVLTGQDELKSLQEREKAVNDARAEANELAKRQQALREKTRNTVPRTAAEKAATAAGKDLERLARELDRLDQRARQELKEVDAARERVTRLKDLLHRQQRLLQETAVRAGRTDKLTPRINRALAELEAIARAARTAEDEAAEKGTLSELAREVAELARRQGKIADEIEARARLEAAADSLARNVPEAELKTALEEAAKAAPEIDAQALRHAAANLKKDDPEAKARAQKAIQAALSRMASRETLARDEEAVGRDVERALARGPETAQAKLSEAAKQAKLAAERLKNERPGGRAAEAARLASDALHDAANQLRKQADAGVRAGTDEQQAKRREVAALRAEQVAKELEKLAEDGDTKKAGMSGVVAEAKAAAQRAAEELKRAAKAGRARENDRAHEEAGAAADRVERALRAVRESLKEGADLPERQGRVAEDLKHLAEKTKAAEEKAKLNRAGQSAEQAQEALRKSDMGKAEAHQKDVLEALEKLVQQAEAGAATAARNQEPALKRAEAGTGSATDKANRIEEALRKGARSARENDSRRRMEEAGERTREAAEALRRSLRRLKQAMPKSAEQDRREAMEKVERARRSLEGLREAHRNLDDRTKKDLEALATRQQELEVQAKLLEQRLRRLQEKAGLDRVQDAQAHMRQARQRLDAGDPDEAERAQERAEKALREAEKELDREERRYRALRQYELLFKLKEELRNFRRSAQGHRETLQAVDAQVREAGRVTRYIRVESLNPLRARVKTLQGDVVDKAGAVGKEGAVVYTYILNGCGRDLKEVEAQLALKEVGLVPQELLGDVVRRFDLAIKGLERDLRERQQDQQQGQQGQQPGNNKPKLVPPDAEIRMVMVLQKALNEEREGFFSNRPDFAARKATTAERARVERLYHQQGSLAELFDSLRENILGREEEDFDFPEEKEKGEEDQG